MKHTPLTKTGFVRPVRLLSHPLMGASSVPQVIIRSDGDWTAYTPIGKPQSQVDFESYNCSGFGTVNSTEFIMQAAFNLSTNYSPRALGIAAGTKEGTGNDPWKVAETFQGLGAIDESALPMEPNETPEMYYAPSPLPSSITDLGKEWLTSYSFTPEWVFNGDEPLATIQELMMQALQYSPLGASVYAWIQDDNGLYYSPAGVDDNHWIVIFKGVPGQYWLAFDSYQDETGSYIKKLDWNFSFEFVIRYHIGAATKNLGDHWYDKFLDFIHKFLW